LKCILDFIPTATIAWWLQHGRQLAATPQQQRQPAASKKRSGGGVKIVDVTNGEQDEDDE
jgi:hypothetical protein